MLTSSHFQAAALLLKSWIENCKPLWSTEWDLFHSKYELWDIFAAKLLWELGMDWIKSYYDHAHCHQVAIVSWTFQTRNDILKTLNTPRILMESQFVQFLYSSASGVDGNWEHNMHLYSQQYLGIDQLPILYILHLMVGLASNIRKPDENILQYKNCYADFMNYSAHSCFTGTTQITRFTINDSRCQKCVCVSVFVCVCVCLCVKCHSFFPLLYCTMCVYTKAH